MNRIVVALFFFVVLVLAQTSLAGNPDNIAPDNEEPVTLEALVRGQVELKQVFGTCPSIEELKANYAQRSDINEAEKRKFLRESRTKIAGLIKSEKQLRKKACRHQNRPNNANFKAFRGDAEKAQNANARQMQGYNFVQRALKGEFERSAIPEEIFRRALYNLASLRHLHLNNRQISLELARSGTSDIYGNRPALHFQDRERDFELKAHDLFATLMQVFIFANDHGLLIEMFHVLANSNGCLEARYRNLYNWFRSENLMHRLEEEESITLFEKAEEAVYIWLAENQEHLNSIPEIKGPARKGLARRICRAFYGKKSSDGKSITPNFVLRLLEEVFILTPDSSFDSPETSHG